MDRPPPHKKLTRILEEQLNRLPPPVHAVVSALKNACLQTLRAFLPEPVGPPAKKVPPTPGASAGRPSRPGQYPPQPGATKPPAVPNPRQYPSPPNGQRPKGSARPGTTEDDLDEDKPTTLLGTDVTTGHKIWLSLNERFHATYCIGANGTGKSTLLLNMILSDIRLNRGLCVIEPHGDLVRNVLAAMPEERLKDAIYLDLTDCTSSFGLNFFECPVGADLTEVAKVASFVMHTFEKVWSVGTETPRLAQVLRNTTRLLIENRGMTFSEISLLLFEDGVREKLMRRLSNIHTKLFWSQYNKKTPRDREELIASTINKVDAYLN